MTTTRRKTKRGQGDGPTRYALYLRFSTEGQGESAYSTIDSQREICTRWVLENGGTIAAEYIDEAKTGTNLARPGYRRLIEGAQTGLFDVVAVSFMSRLGRGDAFVLAREELARFGVGIQLVKEDFGTGISGYAAESVTRLVDGLYPKMVKQWTEAKMIEMLAQGFVVSGNIPFGYTTVPAEGVLVPPGKKAPRRMVPKEGEAEVVLRAFERMKATRAVGQVLSLLRLESAQAWNHTTVRRLLQNRSYLGERTWGEHINRTNHPPLVSADLFDAVQQILDEPRPLAPRLDAIVPATDFLLRGKVICACGSRMTQFWSTGRGGIRYLYYRCQRAMKWGHPCPIGQVSALKLHAGTIGELIRMGEHPWRLRTTLAAAAERLGDTTDLDRAITSERKALRNAERERANFETAIGLAVGGGSSSALSILVGKLDAAEKRCRAIAGGIAGLESERKTALASRPNFEQMQGRLKNFAALWRAARESEQAELASLLIRQVSFIDRHQVDIYILSDFDAILSEFAGRTKDGLNNIPAKGG